MNIAIVHDHLTCKGGGERVALTFHRAFPSAPIYTLSYNPEATFEEFKDCNIKSSWFQRITNDQGRLKKLFFPLGILAMRSLNLDSYDVILISGTNCAKYIRVNEKAVVINYCYTPFRLAWNPTSYSEYSNSKGLKRHIFDLVIKILRHIDISHAKRTNHFLAMTIETKLRIQHSYQPINEITIFNPPVNNIDSYYISKHPKKYYLLVSRMEFYKKVDLAILAFNKLQLPLIIVGKGTQEENLKAIVSSKHILFEKNVSPERLADLYSNCKAFLFPQHEDYGLTALEANASGRPVIAYKKGGVIDTQIPYENDNKATALFFDLQTEECLIEAIKRFEAVEKYFDSEFIRSNAQRFNENQFIKNIQGFVRHKILH